MRILMTTDTVGGVWNYALQLAGCLAPSGIDVHLATMGAPLAAHQAAAAAAIPNLTLHPSTFKLEWMPEPWEDVARAGQWLLGLERELQPDLVHLNGYAHGALPFRAPKLVVGHSCVLSWWQAVRHEEAPVEWARYRKEVSAGLHGADHVVTPSQAMLDALLQHYGPLASAQVIYNGRPPVAFRGTTKLQMIFSAGRFWDEAKNLVTLDSAAARIPWPVFVAGDTRHPAGTTVTPPQYVTCLGQLSEQQVATRLAFAMIYALPARYEPFGLSILEAALAGCALVLGDIPSLRELWRDAATFVPPDEPDVLVHAIQALMEHPTRRAALAFQAQMRAREFSAQRMAAAYVQCYGALVSPPGGRLGALAQQPILSR